MFTWICPKCGKEVPPSYSECPNCSAAAQATAPPSAPPAAEVKPQTAAPRRQPMRARSHKTGILLSVVFAAAFVVVGLTVVVLVRSRSEAPPMQQAAPAALESPPTAAPAGAAGTKAPAEWRHIEVAGLRLSEDAKQKPVLQVVLINHSAADLGEITAKGNLKAVSGTEQKQVGTFAIKTSLGPYESKDVRVPLDTRLRAYELPDWQFLRAELSLP